MVRVIGQCLLALALLGWGAGCKGKAKSTLAQAAMACPDEEMSCVRPILNVHNLRDSQAYFRDALGFKLDWEHGKPPDFASVSRGNSVLFLCQGCQGTPGAWMMIFTRNVDDLHAEIRHKQARIRMPPRDMPWGLREMHVSDPDGNVIRFGMGIDH